MRRRDLLGRFGTLVAVAGGSALAGCSYGGDPDDVPGEVAVDTYDPVRIADHSGRLKEYTEAPNDYIVVVDVTFENVGDTKLDEDDYALFVQVFDDAGKSVYNSYVLSEPTLNPGETEQHEKNVYLEESNGVSKYELRLTRRDHPDGDVEA